MLTRGLLQTTNVWRFAASADALLDHVTTSGGKQEDWQSSRAGYPLETIAAAWTGLW